VAEVTEEGRVDIIGIGSAESKGIRKGVVINLDQTVDCIKRVVEEAELMAGVEIDSAHVGLAGSHIKGFNSRAVVAITGKTREIAREDVFRAIDAAKAISIPSDREIIHVVPQEFVVDGHDGIDDPTGMTGSRLEANVHIITASATATSNIVTCVNRAGMEVTESVLEQLAAAEAVLTPDEKELGVALVDIGGGTTDLAIFDKGSIWHTSVLPTGGDHFTSDVAVGLRTPIAEAEIADPDRGSGEDQEEVRLRAGDDDLGGGHHRGPERRWKKVADPAAAAPLGHHPAPGGGDLPSDL